MPHEFGIKGLMLGANHPSGIIEDEALPSHKRSIMPTKMYYERVSSTSQTANIPTKIFSERLSTSRSTAVSSKVFREVSSSRIPCVSSSRITADNMTSSLRSKIPTSGFIRKEISTSQKPPGLFSVEDSELLPQRNIITRTRVNMEKAKYEKKIKSTQVESRLPTSRTRKSLLPAPKSLPGSVKSGAESPCQSPTSDNPRSKNLLIGQRVGTADGLLGTLKFKGKTHFSQGCVCGIILDSPEGKNNGIIDGIQYFRCEPNHGIFVSAHKVSIVSPSGVRRLLETPPTSPLVSPQSPSSYSSKESNLYSKIPGAGNEQGKTSRPKTLQVFQESKTGTKQSSFKQGNKHSTDNNNRSKVSEKAKTTSGNKLFQNKKISPVQSKLVLPGWTGDKTPGSPKPTSRLPELRSKCKSATTTVTVAKDEVPSEETASAEKVRSKRTPEQGSPSVKCGFKYISRGLTSRPSLNDLTQLPDVDPLETPSPLNHPDVLEGCVRILNKTFDISETSPSSEEEELDVSCAIKPLPECVRAPRTLDLTYDLTPEGLPSITCFPRNFKHQTTSTPIRCEPREYRYKTYTSPEGFRELKETPRRVDIPVCNPVYCSNPENEEDIEYDEFLAVPSCLDTPTGKCRFDLLTPEEFEQALQEYTLLSEEQEAESAAVTDAKAEASPDRFKPKIWESITVVEDELLKGIDSTFAEPSFLVPTEWSMDEGAGNPQPPKRDEASADAEVPCLDKLPDSLSTPDTINGTFHDDLIAGVNSLLKGDDDFGIAQGGAPMFPDDVVNNNNNVDFLVPEDQETDTSVSASGLQLSWENMEVESGQMSDDQLGSVAAAAPFQTVFDSDDHALTMGSFSEMEFHLQHERPLMDKEDPKLVGDELSSSDHLEGDSVCNRTFTCDDAQNVEESPGSAICDRTFTAEGENTTPVGPHIDMFANCNGAASSLPKSNSPIETGSPDSPMEYCTGSEPSKAMTGPCDNSDSQQDEIVAMDTVTGQQEAEKTLCGTVTVSGHNGEIPEESSDSGSTMVEESILQTDKTLKRQASPPSELSTVVQVESIEMTSPSPHSIPTYTPSSSSATSPSQNGKDDSKDNIQTKNLFSQDDSRLPRKRSLLQQPKPVSMCSSSGSEISKIGQVSAQRGSKPKLPRQKSHEQKPLLKDLKKDQSRKSASNSAMESLSKKTYTPASWRSNKSVASSPSRSSVSSAKPVASVKPVKKTSVRSKIDTGRRASDGAKNAQLLRKLHASTSSCDLEPNSLSSSTRSMRSDMSSNGGGGRSATGRLMGPPVRPSAIPIRKNRQTYRPGKPVNKVTHSLKKRDDKRRDRKTSTSSINSVESSQRAESRASLSSRPSSRSDVSPDAKPKKRPRQSVRKDALPFVQGKLNPPQSPVRKSRLVKPSSTTVRKQSSIDRGQQSKNERESNGVVQVDAAPTRRPGHMSRSSMPSRRSVTGTDPSLHPSRIGGKPPPGMSKESAPNRTKLAKTKGHLAPSTQSNIVSPSILTEISRLEALCEARTKELNLTKLQLKSNLQGFDAMSVLVQYLSHQLDAFSTPKLKMQLKLIERQLTTTNRRIEAYEEDISRLKYEIAAKEERHQEEVHRTHDEYKNQLAQLEDLLQNQHLEQTEKMKQQNRQQLDNSDLEHQNELSELAGVHRMAFREQEEQHIEQVTSIEQSHHDHIEEINREHQLNVEMCQASAENKQRRLQDDVLTWKYQCESHKEKVILLQDALRKDSDAKVQAAIAQYKHLPDEVESMKAVLEMKNTELHNLRIENMNLQKEVERIPDYQERIKRLETKVEELNAIVIRKQAYERQLSSEHIALRENYQREANEKKRLSMENEQLAWKLSTSCDADSPGSLTPPRFDPSPSPTRPSKSFLSSPSPTRPSTVFSRTTSAESPESGVFSPSNQTN